jgi:nucleotide-binding universal stress UspA family protein
MRILVATDGSRGSGAAIHFAARLAARDARTELIVLSVETRDGGVSVGSGFLPLHGKATGGALSQARRILESAARGRRQKSNEARFRLISTRGQDQVPEAISREADRVRADLVVIGSEGRDTLNEWVVGGTALRLIYVAKRPVTVVRPPRRRKVS